MSGFLITWVLMFGTVDDSRIEFTVTTGTETECLEIQRYVEAQSSLVVFEPCTLQAIDVVLI